MAEEVGRAGERCFCVKMVAVALEMSGLETRTAACESPKEHG